jgi:L-lactate dehydrogenase complex protein LldG
LLRVSAGVPTGAEAVGLAAAACAIAETGTLMLTSGSGRPASLNFLPETFLAVLPVNRIAPALEDAWDRLRRLVPGTLPRTVNFINGPSRTGDIEQKLQMGAHGPRRVHILMIEDGALD